MGIKGTAPLPAIRLSAAEVILPTARACRGALPSHDLPNNEEARHETDAKPRSSRPQPADPLHDGEPATPAPGRLIAKAEALVSISRSTRGLPTLPDLARGLRLLDLGMQTPSRLQSGGPARKPEREGGGLKHETTMDSDMLDVQSVSLASQNHCDGWQTL